MRNSLLAESLSRFVAEVHGDSPGHPFRGNQWKDGFGNEDKKRLAPGDPKRAANFKKLFGKSKVVDENGDPLVVYHGTTQSFDAFDPSKTNPESDLGGGFYFTNEGEDVGNNYAGIGPDLSQKIEMEAERIAGEEDKEYDDPDVVARARAKFLGHGGAAMPVFLKMDNPVVIGGSKETFLDMESEYIDDHDGYAEPTGKLVDFVDAIQRESRDFSDAEPDDFVDSIFEHGMDGGLKIGKILDLFQKSQMGQYATDDQGRMASKEILRRALERIGFDGIIDKTVDSKFGSQKRIGKPMQGMNPDTVHYVVFKPTQIKSAIGNRGTFSPKDKRITHGDLPGHEFRGNQWTGGRGGASESRSRYAGSPVKWDLRGATPEQVKAAAKAARAYTSRIRTVQSIPVKLRNIPEDVPKEYRDIVEAQLHAGLMQTSKLTRDMMAEQGWVVRVDPEDPEFNDSSGTFAYADHGAKKLVLGLDAVLQSDATNRVAEFAHDTGMGPRLEQQIFQHELSHIETGALQRAVLTAAAAGEGNLLRRYHEVVGKLQDAIDDEGSLTNYSEMERTNPMRTSRFASRYAISTDDGPGGRMIDQLVVPGFIDENVAEVRAVVEGNLWSHKETGHADVDKTHPKTLAAYAEMRALIGDATKFMDTKGEKLWREKKIRPLTDDEKRNNPVQTSQVAGLMAKRSPLPPRRAVRTMPFLPNPWA